MLLADPIHLPALRQGVTTYIIGQDGSSFAPAVARDARLHAALHRRVQRQPAAVVADWRTVDEYLARFDRATALNVAYLIPNGNVRMEVMGLDPRPARDDEIRAMQALVRQGMDAGAVGLSTGLDYIPSRYADAREIAALCEAIAPADGVYVTHMRGYGPKAAEGMAEVYEIARSSGVAGPRLALQRPGRPLAPPDRPGAGDGPRPDLRYLSLPRRQHDPGHGGPAAVGPGRGDRADARAAWPIRPSAPG